MAICDSISEHNGPAAFVVLFRFISSLHVPLAAHSLCHPPADPPGHLFVHLFALPPGRPVALSIGHVVAHLAADVAAALPWHALARLPRHIHAMVVGHLPLFPLGHVRAVRVGVVPAGSRNGHPDLAAAPRGLPLVLAVLPVAGDALGLDVVLVGRPELLGAHLVMLGPANFLRRRVAHPVGPWPALCPVPGPAPLLVHCAAVLGLCLLVLGLPEGVVDGTASD